MNTVATLERPKTKIKPLMGPMMPSKEVYRSKISANGQITLPKEVREKLKIKAGDTVVLSPIKNGFEISKQESLRDEMAKWRKRLTPETRELIQKTAGWTANQYHEYFDNLPESIEEMENEYGLK